MLILTACAGTQDPAEKYKGFSAEKLYWQGITAMKKTAYKDAIEKFEALDARYPFGEYAEKEQLYIIYAYYRDGDYPEALAATERFIHLHPDSKHVDYAYYMQGMMNYEQNWGIFERYFKASDLSERDLQPAKKSLVEFGTLVRSYPNSAYRGNAIQFMIYIRNLLANKNVEIAQFYLDRKAYIAASNRATDVILHYDGSPSVEEALVVAIKANQAMNLDNVADMYIDVLKLNFPDNEYLKSLDQAK